jgi:hypothetical protein
MNSLSHLTYPNKSHRKQIIIPQDSIELAEFFGIMIGDGGINNDWQINISLNSISDRNYADYVSMLGIKLFGIKPAIRIRKESQVIIVSFASINLIEALMQKGILKGNKLKQNLNIPDWIMQSSDYKIACVRGLVDTDGGLYLHRHTVSSHYYENIGLCFTSFSRVLIDQVAGVFNENGIKAHISKDYHKIYLYSSKSVEKYLEVFSSSNQRILSFYSAWRGARVV